MVSQGFLGALAQYFTVEDKPRLDRRNTWFEDHYQLFEQLLLQVGIVACLLVITIVILWCLGGVFL